MPSLDTGSPARRARSRRVFRVTMTDMTAAAPSRPAVADSGEVTFYAAITGTADEVGDVIVPGAFARTLATRRPKIVRAHDWRQLVGKVTHIEELRPGDKRLPARTAAGEPWPRQAGALLVRGKLNTASREGKAAAHDVEFFGPDAAFSIGYKTARSRQRGRLREIADLDLYEVSVAVLHGAHPLARVVDDPGPALETKAMTTGPRRLSGDWRQVQAKAGRLGLVPLDARDEQRAERLRRKAAVWPDDDDKEPFESVAARDRQYEMTADGRLLTVLPCARCGGKVRLPSQAAPTGAEAQRVKCDDCRQRRRR